MTNDRTPLFLRGVPASPGIAQGPLLLLGDEGARTTRRVSESARGESKRLREALGAACSQLVELKQQTADSNAQMLLTFQATMLEDPALSESAFASVDAGVPAERAWHEAMEAHIRHYESSADSYFRSRASDFRDMHDRVARILSGTSAPTVDPRSIVVAADLAPSRFLEIPWEGGGIALTGGSTNSHVAMLARARGVPMLIALEPNRLEGHLEAVLDAEEGMLIASADAEVRARVAQRARARPNTAEQSHLREPAMTASGERVQVLINIAGSGELANLEAAWCDGIGLVRTELLFHDPADLHDEDLQYEEYRRILRWADGRPVTLRLLDAGGDKPIAGYTVDGEANPFLGVRGVRLSLLHPDVLNAQLRALARAAALGRLQVMVPMVTTPHELAEVRRYLIAALDSLRKEGIDAGTPELGMMVEVPAAALAIELFDAQFLSIGSNDLIQYVTGCSRDSQAVAALTDPLQPGVLRLMRHVVEHANARQISVSVCGDMASEPRCIPALLGMGLRRLSVAPAALARVKAAIAQYRSDD